MELFCFCFEFFFVLRFLVCFVCVCVCILFVLHFYFLQVVQLDPVIEDDIELQKYSKVMWKQQSQFMIHSFSSIVGLGDLSDIHNIWWTWRQVSHTRNPSLSHDLQA